MGVALGKHQLKAIERLDSGSILTGGVGTGKSRTSVGYYYLKECKGQIRVNGEGVTRPMEIPTDLYIITTAKKRDSGDWEEEVRRFGLENHPVTVTVDSWNNIGKYEQINADMHKKDGDMHEKRRAFFIFDEQRLVGSGAWVKSFLKITKNNRWILLSATPGDTWMDYVPVFVANGFYKNRTEFTERHVVYARFAKYPKVDRYLETGTLEKHRREISVDMPYERHTVRHNHYLLADYDRDAYDRVVKKRWNIFTNKPCRDIAELISAARRVVNSDPSRVELIRGILDRELAMGNPQRLIIFYNFNYELDILREAFSAEVLKLACGHFVASAQLHTRDNCVLCGEPNKVEGVAVKPFNVAEWNGHNHDPLPTGDRWIYLVQYTAGAEGWNCTTTDKVLFYSLNYSYRVMEQGKGRVDRLDTPYTDLHYYTIKSSSSIDSSIRKALREKRNFNVTDFAG